MDLCNSCFCLRRPFLHFCSVQAATVEHPSRSQEILAAPPAAVGRAKYLLRAKDPYGLYLTLPYESRLHRKRRAGFTSSRLVFS